MNTAEVEVETSQSEKNALGIEYNIACVIGTRLKDARENASISKEKVAKKAKIRERYLEAIEFGDWDVLPPGLNGRGLVRLYAKELGVQLPEFDEFNNLQTIQAEKQSEHLSHNNFNKKSRYQPAAEESAEIIKIVPRSEYKHIPLEDNFSNNYDNSSNKTQNRVSQNRTHHTAAIVTPKISDILGIDLSNFNMNELKIDNDIETKINSNMERNNLHVLPMANPISKIKKFEPLKNETQKPSSENEVVLQHILPETNNTHMHQNAPNEPVTKKQFNKKKLIIYSLSSIVFLSIACLVYLVNSQDYKIKTQPKNIATKANEPKMNTRNIILPTEIQKPAQDKVIPQPLIPPTVQALAPIERSAKVDILARVKLQIEADGKDVFSGYRQPGPLEFNFKDKAEILVYDASKVKLTYGAWDHGELGWNERKRKITLNAKSYEE